MRFLKDSSLTISAGVAVKVAIIAMAYFFITSQSVRAEEAEKAGNSQHQWLNGKWSGPAPLGGELQLELRVVDNSKVIGNSTIPRPGGKRPASGTIQGSVNGDQVTLEISYTRSTQNWRFHRKDQTLVATRKGEELVFKKVDRRLDIAHDEELHGVAE